jgi:integrase
VLRLALEQAVRRRWLSENPALHASPPGVPRREPTPPNPTHARALIEAAQQIDPEWATYLRTATALGARPGEVCALRWPAVDLRGRTVSIQRAVIVGSQGVVDREYPKNASSRRRVALDAGTAAALASQRRRQAERALEFGTHPVRDGYVFSSEVDASRPWNPQVVDPPLRAPPSSPRAAWSAPARPSPLRRHRAHLGRRGHQDGGRPPRSRQPEHDAEHLRSMAAGP